MVGAPCMRSEARAAGCPVVRPPPARRLACLPTASGAHAGSGAAAAAGVEPAAAAAAVDVARQQDGPTPAFSNMQVRAAPLDSEQNLAALAAEPASSRRCRACRLPGIARVPLHLLCCPRRCLAPQAYGLQEEDWSRSALSICVVGASGDLAKKKIFPALFALYIENMLPKVCARGAAAAAGRGATHTGGKPRAPLPAAASASCGPARAAPAPARPAHQPINSYRSLGHTPAPSTHAHPAPPAPSTHAHPAPPAPSTHAHPAPPTHRTHPPPSPPRTSASTATRAAP